MTYAKLSCLIIDQPNLESLRTHKALHYSIPLLFSAGVFNAGSFRTVSAVLNNAIWWVQQQHKPQWLGWKQKTLGTTWDLPQDKDAFAF